MKTFLIAKRDFKSGFSTPKTGAIIFFVVALISIFFALFIQSYQQQANPMLGGGAPQTPPIQHLIRSLVFNFYFILLLIIPAVTMGTFSDEIKSQSIRFLQTAPISTASIVLGKFLSRWVTVLLAVLLCAVQPIFLAVYGNPEVPAMLSAYLGLVLVISFQVAFGVWVSSLTSEQFIAFIFTMLGLFSFLMLDFIGDTLAGSSGYVKDVLEYLAPMNHFENLTNGLITLGDVTYFLVMTFGFLFFANVSFDSRRWR
ncbi:MAG: ABC transporter permease subunit [Proteobacteria bacterium]|nr:ABC transporter permease subunit [Pseudomonadota bacterium]